MKVRRWGDSLAVRLPAEMVKALGLKEGDEIEMSVVRKRSLRISREQALEQLRNIKWPFPADFHFNREEANER
jgi:antitoxin MazE